MPRVLIVEDEQTVRDLLSETLGTSHECVAIGSAEEGLVLLRSERFDAAITDVMLPDYSGLQFIRWMRERMGSDTPIIAMTAFENGYLVAAMHLGADAAGFGTGRAGAGVPLRPPERRAPHPEPAGVGAPRPGGQAGV